MILGIQCKVIASSFEINGLKANFEQINFDTNEKSAIHLIHLSDDPLGMGTRPNLCLR